MNDWITQKDVIKTFTKRWRSEIRKWIWFRSEVRKKIETAIIDGVWIANNYPNWTRFNEQEPDDGAHIFVHFDDGRVDYCKYDVKNKVTRYIFQKHNAAWIYKPYIPPYK